jgi:hypothetical protein
MQRAGVCGISLQLSSRRHVHKWRMRAGGAPYSRRSTEVNSGLHVTGEPRSAPQVDGRTPVQLEVSLFTLGVWACTV